MSAALRVWPAPGDGGRLLSSPALPWVVALLGFLALYLPVYLWAASTIWQTDEQAHGPLILAVLAWLFWSLRHALMGLKTNPRVWLGAAIFALGLGFYLLGRLFSISILEFGSQIWVLSGVLLILGGVGVIRLAWFPIFYLIFMVPLPGFLVDALTGPLKQWISSIVENGLYWVGYPVARHGVTISIGPYQLLVADACSGLNSMFSLTAVGTLYMYLMGRASRWHNLLMLCAILPVAFVANVIRVVVLVLLTYHFGDEVGQSYLHGAAGMVLMLVSIGILFMMDAALTWFFGSRRRG